MPAKICVFLTGVVYLFFGISGFFPSLVSLPPPRLRFYDMTIIGHWGFLFSWLPVNPVHNVVYVIIGGVAILAAVSQFTAVWYARGLFFVMFLFAVTGLLPFGIAQLFGLMPLFAWNIMLHSVTAMLLYYYGFIYPLDLGGKEPISQVRTLQVRP
jgi:hypothetical protein